MTKLYVINHNNNVQLCGSVTEVCKFLSNHGLDEKQTRKLIVESFAKCKTALNIKFKNIDFNISAHRMESEVRLHGCW